MTKLRTTEPTLPRIRDTGTNHEIVDASIVEGALGAEQAGQRLENILAPITLFAVREELVKRLQSTGGRPSLAGTSRRAKIPLADKEWLELERLAAALSVPGFAPSAGQVASVLLNLSVQSLSACNLETKPFLAQDISNRVAAARVS